MTIYSAGSAASKNTTKGRPATKTNIDAIRKAARIARSPRPGTPSAIAFVVKKPGQDIHPVHKAWDDRNLYQIAREMFLLHLSSETVYTVLEDHRVRDMATGEERDDIIKRAAYDTRMIRELAKSIRRGRSYLKHQLRERTLQVLANRYPVAVNVAELCSILQLKNARSLTNVLGRYPAWFRRVSRGQYQLVDEEVVESVYQRVLDAQRAREVNEYMEQYVKDAAFSGVMNDAFIRYINSPALAGTGLKEAHAAGTLEETVFNLEVPDLGDDFDEEPADSVFAAQIADRLEITDTPAKKEVSITLHPAVAPETPAVDVDVFFAQYQPGQTIKAGDMYVAYLGWCQSHDVESVSQTRFGVLVRAAGFTVKHTMYGKTYKRS